VLERDLYDAGYVLGADVNGVKTAIALSLMLEGEESIWAKYFNLDGTLKGDTEVARNKNKDTVVQIFRIANKIKEGYIPPLRGTSAQASGLRTGIAKELVEDGEKSPWADYFDYKTGRALNRAAEVMVTEIIQLARGTHPKHKMDNADLAKLLGKNVGEITEGDRMAQALTLLPELKAQEIEKALPGVPGPLGVPGVLGPEGIMPDQINAPPAEGLLAIAPEKVVPAQIPQAPAVVPGGAPGAPTKVANIPLTKEELRLLSLEEEPGEEEIALRPELIDTLKEISPLISAIPGGTQDANYRELIRIVQRILRVNTAQLVAISNKLSAVDTERVDYERALQDAKTRIDILKIQIVRSHRRVNILRGEEEWQKENIQLHERLYDKKAAALEEVIVARTALKAVTERIKAAEKEVERLETTLKAILEQEIPAIQARLKAISERKARYEKDKARVESNIGVLRKTLAPDAVVPGPSVEEEMALLDYDGVGLRDLLALKRRQLEYKLALSETSYRIAELQKQLEGKRSDVKALEHELEEKNWRLQADERLYKQRVTSYAELLESRTDVAKSKEAILAAKEDIELASAKIKAIEEEKPLLERGLEAVEKEIEAEEKHQEEQRKVFEGESTLALLKKAVASLKALQENLKRIGKPNNALDPLIEKLSQQIEIEEKLLREAPEAEPVLPPEEAPSFVRLADAVKNLSLLDEYLPARTKEEKAARDGVRESFAEVLFMNDPEIVTSLVPFFMTPDGRIETKEQRANVDRLFFVIKNLDVIKDILKGIEHYDQRGMKEGVIMSIAIDLIKKGIDSDWARYFNLDGTIRGDSEKIRQANMRALRVIFVKSAKMQAALAKEGVLECRSFGIATALVLNEEYLND